MKSKVFFILGLVLVLNLFLWPSSKTSFEEQISVELNKFEVTLAGEVNFPGTYFFYNTVTLEEVINYAGKFTNNADKNDLNLNLVITKDYYLKVKSIEKSNGDDEIIFNKVNINEATFLELLSVPNITETRAANIIIYRQQFGAFNCLEDLLNVKYIGNTVLEKISPYLTV